MKKSFAKLFGRDVDQILVELGRHPETLNPRLRIAFHFPDDGDLGVCEMSINFADDDIGWDKAEKAFDEIDEFKARKNVKNQIELIRNMSDN